MKRLAIALLVLAASTPAQADFELHGPAGSAFGHSLATCGDLDGDLVPDLVVGAPDADLAGTDSGAVFVHSGAGGALLLTLPGAGPADDFGWSVAGAGDLDGDGVPDLLAGAHQDTDDIQGSGGNGAGYVLAVSGVDGAPLRGWLGQSLVDETNDFFGASVAGAGDLDGDGVGDLAVGEPWSDVEGTPTGLFAGRGHVFSGATGAALFSVAGIGVGSYDWTDVGRSVLSPGDLDGDGTPEVLVGAASGSLGGVMVASGATGAVLQLVSLDGNHNGLTLTALGDVDADGVPDFAVGGSEQAHVISGASLSTLTTYSGAGNAQDGGLSVVTVGDANADGQADYVVTEPVANMLGGPESGALRLYSGANGGLLLQVGGPSAGAHYGRGVAVLHDDAGLPRLVIGAPFDDPAAGVDAGTVYVLDVSSIVPAPLVLLGSLGPYDGFGLNCAAAGDADNDGWADVIAGGPYDGTSAMNAGRADVFSGRDGQLLFSFFGKHTSDRLGWSVDGAGDVDQDGCADVLAGAPYPLSANGPAYVQVRSGATGLLLREIPGGGAGDQHGTAVSGLGDISGDGLPDVVAGAPGADLGGSEFGAARVFSAATGVMLHLKTGTASGGQFGASVAGVGDVDADGSPDFAVGARYANTGGGNASGRTQVWSGATGALLLQMDGDAANDNSGWSIDAAGDVNGDGHADVLLGEPYNDQFGVNAGRARVISGDTGATLLVLPAPSGGLITGQAVAGAGDATLDSVPDLLVGAPGTSVANLAQAGVATLHSGADGALVDTLYGATTNGQLGWSVAGNSDIDNDGVPDLIVSAAGSQGYGGSSGVVLVFNVNLSMSPWSSAGAVLPGAAGAAVLTGSGPLTAGSLATLDITGAKPAAPTTLVVGLSLLAAPFKGGTLVPSLDLLLAGLVTDGTGAWSLASTWPALPAATQVRLQAWWPDSGGPAGFAASNAVLGVVP